MVFCDEPNKYARPARLELYDRSAFFHGYQEFALTKDTVEVLPEDTNLAQKHKLLTPYFTPGFLARRSVLDLGANAGFFSFWSLQNGAEQAIAVDIDEQYIRMIEQARDRLGFKDLATAKTNVSDWQEPADVVLAIALLHWIYSCTALFGSLDAAIGRLAQLTKYLLIIEWVDPSDPAFDILHHTEWNEDTVREPYSFEAFEKAMEHHFAQYQYIGEVTPTRRLYAGFCTSHMIDLSGPQPLSKPTGQLISAKGLATDNGIQYWSYVFDGGDVIYKQATLDLAEREAFFLSTLSGQYFPRVIDVRMGDGYSVVALEKIRGIPFEQYLVELGNDTERLQGFFGHCLHLLGQLKEQGIVHRDIREENLLVRNGQPVLLDFGWAISDARPYFTPIGLGRDSRPPDGSFCDVYSLGKAFDQVGRQWHSAFNTVIALMTAPDPALRITDLGILETLSTVVNEAPGGVTARGVMDQHTTQDATRDDGAQEVQLKTIQHLLTQIANRDERLTQVRSDQEQTLSRLAHHEHALSVLRPEIAHLERAAQGLATQVKEREREVRALTAHLAEQEQEARALAARLEEREREARTLTAHLEGQHLTTQALSAQLADYERRTNDLTTRLQGWEEHWQLVQATIGWTAVQQLQHLRKQVAPTNSLREKLWLKVARTAARRAK